MRQLFPLVLALAVAFPAFGQLVSPGGENAPRVGDMAPDFVVTPGGRGAQPVNLSNYRGDKYVLLMFFPGAFTPGCTTEFTEAGQFHDRFVEMGIELIGISRDLRGALNAFRESTGARNLFVSDPDLAVINQYGARNAGGTASRFYFLIDREGKIVWSNTQNQLLNTANLLTELSPIVRSAD